ncbi:MAG: hypothetical protein K8F36_10020 [Melioribacteraceae bacterium]|nr:hypothetical protein [Melioribacteraceae bacterium]
MYNIDLSFWERVSLTHEELKQTEEKCNRIYHDLILDKYPCNCFHEEETINASKEVKKRVVEAYCAGLIGWHFCEISEDLDVDLTKGDQILIQLEDGGVELAEVLETDSIVEFRQLKLGCTDQKMPVFLRKLTNDDKSQLDRNNYDETRAKPIFFEKIKKYDLLMKLVGIHYQFDRKKLYFFYTSDGRVDFRELAKDLAGEFKTRIELRQMGVRDEARKIGGIGTCGREYCCSSFITNFKRISTNIAAEQNLSANLSKLSGPCGKLKCCLSFELEEHN